MTDRRGDAAMMIHPPRYPQRDGSAMQMVAIALGMTLIVGGLAYSITADPAKTAMSPVIQDSLQSTGTTGQGSGQAR
jgi:hypothetical protein